MGKMAQLPVRLEAWDADAAEDGWAIDVKDMRLWLESLLREKRTSQSEMILGLETMIKHLT